MVFSEELAMGLSRIEERSPVTPQRPTTLLLEPAFCKEENNNNTTEMIGFTGSQNAPRRKKKRRAADSGVKKFNDLYEPTGEALGCGATGSVATYRNIITNQEYAVKMIRKKHDSSRKKVLKEIEIFHHTKDHPNILQLFEYFEEDECFYMVFEKMEGGTLLETILRKGHLTEQEASLVIRDLAKAIDHLHKKGIAHRDLKPENILCVKAGHLTPVKICDFDLGSGVVVNSETTPATTPELLTPVGSAEFMAPEVVDVWQDQAWCYDKRCDLWSLGIILYILLCGYPPFYGQCGQDCDWEKGPGCKNCQDMLFQCIQDGYYEFPDEEWCDISEDAKDLIQHLLVKDPHQRFTAAEVLDHPWVAMESSRAPLATPRVLQRNNSVKELEAFAENANAYNRLILRHLSISEAYEPASFRVGEVLQEDDCLDDHGGPVFSIPGDKDHMMFKIGDDSSDEGSNSSSGDEDHAPILWMALSPPGESSLARRRLLSKGSSGDSQDSNDSGNGNGIPISAPHPHHKEGKRRGGKPRSPPKVASAIF